MSEETSFAVGVTIGAGLVLFIMILLTPTGIVERQPIGDFVCFSHGLGEYKEIKIAEGQVLWVSCAKEPKQENQTKIRPGGKLE